MGDAVRDAGPRVVVLSAEGPSFSAGLDRAMFTGQVPGSAACRSSPRSTTSRSMPRSPRTRTAFTWWREVDALTVAAVQGHAVGAGFQLALACDLRVVADDVAFAMKETSLGLVPDLAGTWPLVEALGYARALEVCVSGRMVAAAEAVATGLAVATVPPERLPGAVDDAGGLAAGGARAGRDRHQAPAVRSALAHPAGAALGRARRPARPAPRPRPRGGCGRFVTGPAEQRGTAGTL